MIPGPLPVPCVSSLVQLCAQNCDHLPPPNPYISEMAFSHRFRIHIPPQGNDILVHGLKVEKNREKCEFAPCWHKLNVPERYTYANHDPPTATSVATHTTGRCAPMSAPEAQMRSALCDAGPGEQASDGAGVARLGLWVL